jgi:hypothetical protein
MVLLMELVKESLRAGIKSQMKNKMMRMNQKRNRMS